MYVHFFIISQTLGFIFFFVSHFKVPLVWKMPHSISLNSFNKLPYRIVRFTLKNNWDIILCSVSIKAKINKKH